jgi:hypothetical protein
MPKKKLVLWLAGVGVVALAVAIALGGHDSYLWVVNRDICTKLFAAIRPVRLSNCTLKHFGAAGDGGYLLCENLLGQARSAYSYGIDGRDEWGCDVARAYHLPVHQYDCFNPKRPVCEGVQFDFHDQCVGVGPARLDHREYDSFTNQIANNGDADKHLLVKMDVENAEWDVLAETSDQVLDNVDQLVVEFHGFRKHQGLELIAKLKRIFYIANVHFNNFACTWWCTPLPAVSFEVLLVNKRLGIPDPANPWAVHPNPLDTPNDPSEADCQARATW